MRFFPSQIKKEHPSYQNALFIQVKTICNYLAAFISSIAFVR